MKPATHFTLSHDEALVLEDALYELDESDKRQVFDDAQWVAIWKLMGQLEKQLSEPFRDDYRNLVTAAKERLVGGGDGMKE
ncbi:MAG: hypothetical protein QM770_20005 [Tepidisphaeraceae bacterium]